MKTFITLIVVLVILYLIFGVRRTVKTNSRLNLRGLPKENAYRKAIRAVIVKWEEFAEQKVNEREAPYLIVKHYTDVITLPQEAVNQVVGTHLTPAIQGADKKEKIKRIIQVILLCYSADRNMAYDSLFEPTPENLILLKNVFDTEYEDMFTKNMIHIYDNKGNVR